MKRVQVLGPGCPECEQFCQNAEAAVKELGIEASVEKIGLFIIEARRLDIEVLQIRSRSRILPRLRRRPLNNIRN